MDELNEKQFNLLKNLCATEAGLVIVPTWAEGDDEKYRETYDSNYAELQSIVKLGFLEDITGELAEAVAESIERTGRGFLALKITEQAFNMFSVPEGSVN